MGKNRVKSGLVHIKNKVEYKVSKEKTTGKFFIRGTQEEIPENKLCRPGQYNVQKMPRSYNFDRPSDAQDLGDEWDHYAWSANDY